MIEAVMFWNEPNNKSHWDFEVDPGWTTFASMVKLAADGVRAEIRGWRVYSEVFHRLILGVKYLRTGLSWSDMERSDYETWFDRMMTALEPFELTLTFCFTPESKGINPHHTSAPRHIEEYADFCTRMVHRYAR